MASIACCRFGKPKQVLEHAEKLKPVHHRLLAVACFHSQPMDNAMRDHHNHGKSHLVDNQVILDVPPAKQPQAFSISTHRNIANNNHGYWGTICRIRMFDKAISSIASNQGKFDSVATMAR